MRLPSIVVVFSLFIVKASSSGGVGESCEWGEEERANCIYCKDAKQGKRGRLGTGGKLGTWQFKPAGSCCFMYSSRGTCDGANGCTSGGSCDIFTSSPTQAPPSFPPATPSPGYYSVSPTQGPTVADT